jgi:hypothetical protein
MNNDDDARGAVALVAHSLHSKLSITSLSSMRIFTMAKVARRLEVVRALTDAACVSPQIELMETKTHKVVTVATSTTITNQHVSH